MKRHYFITGTDTDVGKTVVSTILAMLSNFHYWKPVQCGLATISDSDFVSRYIGPDKVYPEAYKLQHPLSPHLAAKLENIFIDLETIKNIFHNINENVLIEGAGGLMVPLNEKHLMIDFIKALGCPVILVARTQVGTINHTLLSLLALEKWNIPVHSIVLVGTHSKETAEILSNFHQINQIFHLPQLVSLDYKNLNASFDNFSGINL